MEKSVQKRETATVVVGDNFLDECGGDYLGRVQLMTSNSGDCKTGVFPINHFAHILEGEQNDLGKEIDVLLLEWRAKALDVSDKAHPVSNYDSTSEEFLDIRERSGIANSGCMWGPEFLVWLPSIRKFATFFFGSNSARKEAKKVVAIFQMAKAATFKPYHIVKSKFDWFVARATVCSTPFEMPDEDEASKQIEKFMNPPIFVPEEEAPALEDR